MGESVLGRRESLVRKAEILFVILVKLKSEDLAL